VKNNKLRYIYQLPDTATKIQLIVKVDTKRESLINVKITRSAKMEYEKMMYMTNAEVRQRRVIYYDHIFNYIKS